MTPSLSQIRNASEHDTDQRGVAHRKHSITHVCWALICWSTPLKKHPENI